MEIKKERQNQKKTWFSLSFYELLTTVISFAGFVGVILGLASAERGLSSTEHAVSTNTYLQTYGWTLEIDKVLIENPKLRPYFVNYVTAKMPLSFDDSIKAEAIADYVLDNFDAVLNNKTYFKTETSTGQSWSIAVSKYFIYCPFLCNGFVRDSASYNQPLKDAYYNTFGTARLLFWIK